MNNCDACSHNLEVETIDGETYSECSIAKCPLVYRDEILAEIARRVRDYGFPAQAENKCCTAYARKIADAIDGLKGAK